MKCCFLSSYIFPLKRIKTINDLILLKYTSRALIDGTEIFRQWYMKRAVDKQELIFHIIPLLYYIFDSCYSVMW
jgi:hypothetical protein